MGNMLAIGHGPTVQYTEGRARLVHHTIKSSIAKAYKLTVAVLSSLNFPSFCSTL